MIARRNFYRFLRSLIADDPHPVYSRLDILDGLNHHGDAS